MAYWQYSQLRKLDVTERTALRIREPQCQECGSRVMRLAMRETFEPWAWIPTGWLCPQCSAVYIEEK